MAINKTVPQLATVSGLAANDLFPVYDTSELGVEKLKNIPYSDLKSDVIYGLSTDGHSHAETDVEDLDKYTQAEVNSRIDTVSGTLRTDINGKSDSGHSHTESDITDLNKYTQTEVDTMVDTLSGTLQTNIDGKSTNSHIHDERYYTENEIGSLLADKSDTTHNHADLYLTGNKALESYTNGVKFFQAASGRESALGFDDDNLWIGNNVVSGPVLIYGLDSESGYTKILKGDPNGAAELYYDGAVKFQTAAGGVITYGHILPDMTTGASGTVSAYDIGSSTAKIRSLYAHDAFIDAGSLYVNNKKVIEDDMDIITISTDVDQHVKVKTTGTGNVYLTSQDEVDINAAGGVEIDVPSTNPTKHINMTNQSANGNITFSATGTGGSVQFTANDDIDFTSTNGSIKLSGTVDIGSAVIDHGDFSGLDDDDHPQYLKTAGGTLEGNLIVHGDFTVSGTTFNTQTETVQITDNTLLINNGEVGAGVTAGSAGIEVDRGTETNYKFIFDETQDNFRVGETGSEQAVATREDSPTDDVIAVWDSSNVMFSTSAGAKLSDFAAASHDHDSIDYGANTNFSVYDSGLTKTANLKIDNTSYLFFSPSADSLKFGTTGNNITVAPIAGTHTFRVDDSDIAVIDADGLTLASGTNINAFTTDGTLSSNSDDEVATVKALRTYVAANAGSGGGLENWTTVSGNVTATNGDRLLVNTSSAAITITMPSLPSIGEEIHIVDAAINFTDNNCTLGRNGSKIEGYSDDYVLDVDRADVKLVYASTSAGWRLIK